MKRVGFIAVSLCLLAAVSLSQVQEIRRGTGTGSGGGTVGTIVTNAVLVAGDVLAVGTAPTNAVKATSANLTNAIGAGQYQPPGSYLTTQTNVAAANPTGTIGLTAVNGSADTFTRSDGAPALSQAIAPTWTGAHIFQAASGDPVTISNTATTQIGLTINGFAGQTNRLAHMTDNSHMNFDLGKYFWTDSTAGTYGTLIMETADDNGNPFWRTRRARGSLASKTTIADGDFLFSLSADGYDGSKYNIHSDGSITIKADGTWSTTSHPTAIFLNNTAAGTTNSGNPEIMFTAGGIWRQTMSSDTLSPFIAFRRSRGSGVSPTTVNSGDGLGSIAARPYDGSAFSTSADASVNFYASQNFSGSAHGTYVTIENTPNSTVGRLERVRVDNAGNVNIVAGALGFGSATAPDVGLAKTSTGVARISNGSSGRGTLDALAYQVGGAAGITLTNAWTDSGATNWTVIVTGGIITSFTHSP